MPDPKRLSVRAGDNERAELRGVVRGSTGVSQAWAHFDENLAGQAAYCCGQCSCQVEVNCKHVVALVLTAARRNETCRTSRSRYLR